MTGWEGGSLLLYSSWFGLRLLFMVLMHCDIHQEKKSYHWEQDIRTTTHVGLWKTFLCSFSSYKIWRSRDLYYFAWHKRELRSDFWSGWRRSGLSHWKQWHLSSSGSFFLRWTSERVFPERSTLLFRDDTFVFIPWTRPSHVCFCYFYRLLFVVLIIILFIPEQWLITWCSRADCLCRRTKKLLCRGFGGCFFLSLRFNLHIHTHTHTHLHTHTLSIFFLRVSMGFGRPRLFLDFTSSCILRGDNFC